MSDRRGWIGAGVLLAVLLGAQQLVALAAVREDAQPGSLVRLLPSGFVAWVDGGDAPLISPPLRIVLARRAVDAADVATAQQLVAQLPEGPERAELEGRLAERRGDYVTAARDEDRAGDDRALQRVLGELARAGQLDQAIALTREAIARTERNPTEPDVLAEAYWQLGIFEEARAVRADHRSFAETRASFEAYRHAVELGPYSAKYLLAAGGEALTLGDAASAGGYYERVRAVEPHGVDALVGLGQTALLRGDRVAALAYARRARAIAPDAPGVHELDAQLGR